MRIALNEVKQYIPYGLHTKKGVYSPSLSLFTGYYHNYNFNLQFVLTITDVQTYAVIFIKEAIGYICFIIFVTFNISNNRQKASKLLLNIIISTINS